MKRISILSLALATCLGFGCGKKSTTVSLPDGGKATVTRKGDVAEITVKGAHGETLQFAGSESGVSLPENFPRDVPIYPDAKVITSMKTKEITTVSLTTADPPQKVLDFYGEKLKAHGWEIEGTMKMGDGGMVNATKDKHTCIAQAGRDGQKTTITLSVTEK
jgi:hypothetical protein